MERKDIIQERYKGCVILHEASNLKFAVDYQAIGDIVEDVVFMDKGTVLNVCASVWVGCWYEGEIAQFYVQDVKDIPALFKLVFDAGVQQVHIGMDIDSFNACHETIINLPEKASKQT